MEDNVQEERFVQEESLESVFEHDSKRLKWGNKCEFVLTVLGYAVGIGNIWRYPYLCYRNGGGAFIFAYIVMVVLSGWPMYYLEAAIGQFSSTGCISMYRICPIFKGTGFAIIVINIYLNIYYIVIMSYPLLYLVNIMQPTIPWETCDNSWNTDQCVNFKNLTGQTNFNSSIRSSEEEFFHHKILQISEGPWDLGTINWPLFGCLIFSWVLLFICIRSGIETIGKVVYFTSLFPVIVILILLVGGFSLEGSGSGAIYYIKPDFARLTDLKVWADAASQVYYSIGAGWGGVVSMSSFNNFHNNFLRDSLLIVSINVVISITAGFVVFTVLGHLSYMTDVPIDEVANQGPSLAFITYPRSISTLPAAHLWAFLFFSMLFTLGLSTMLIQMQAIITSFIDEYTELRSRQFWVTLGSCIVMFLFSILLVTNGGFYFLTIIDYYSLSLAVVVICFVESIIVMWIYGSKRFSNDILFMMNKPAPRIIIWCLKFITPLVLIFIFVTTITFTQRIVAVGDPLPIWCVFIGWSLCGFVIGFIPIYAIYKIFWKFQRVKSFKEILVKGFAPVSWCPADERTCTRYKRFIEELSMNNEVQPALRN